MLVAFRTVGALRMKQRILLKKERVIWILIAYEVEWEWSLQESMGHSTFETDTE
jgi:hypothetical protein